MGDLLSYVISHTNGQIKIVVLSILNVLGFSCKVLNSLERVQM